MQVISPKPIALLHTCIECGALLTYNFNDIY